MADTTSDAGEKVDIKPIVNSQGDINQPNLNSNGTSQATPITMKQDPVSKDLTLNISESKPASQNGTDGPSVDPTRPLKTEGEASTGFQALTSLASARNLQAKGNITPDAQTSFNTFGNIAGLSTSSLTTQEQAALYKKANLFALSALAKNGGPNVKEMLAIQQKLQEFLTSLITLAGQKGPELKVKVQQLVQNLVSGQVAEDDFAAQIEVDLQSQHQPNLLPFLKSSVPHLKTRLQLQQAIMKELLQRQERERSSPSTPTQPLAPTTVTTTATAATPNPTVAQFSTGSSVTKPIVIGANPPMTKVTSAVSSSQLSTSTTSATESLPNSLSFGSLVLQPALISQLNSQLPKAVRDQIAKLPPDQQKMVYLHHLKRLQALRQQMQSRQTTPTISSASNAAKSTEQIQRAQEQLIKEQQVPLTMSSRNSASKTPANKTSFSNLKLMGSSSPGSSLPGLSPSKGKKTKGKGKDLSVDANEEDEEGMDILDEVGVNLQEESAQFLPQVEGTRGSIQDQAFLDLNLLRRKVTTTARQHGVSEVSEDYLSLLSHATEARLKDILEKVTQISQHRTEVLKDNSQYRVQSEVRGQLRVLETIDRLIDKRKTERENEQTLKAAKSRSKGADPVKAAEIREVARQIQEDKAAIMRDQAANETALKAIGSRRKRPSPQSEETGGSGSGGGPSSSQQTGATSSLFAPLTASRAPKRHVTSRDLIFYLEQERETRKSLTLYKALMK